MMGKFRKKLNWARIVRYFSTDVLWVFTFGSSNPQNLWLRATVTALKSTFWKNLGCESEL
jgi:hypothetical protein